MWHPHSYRSYSPPFSLIIIFFSLHQLSVDQIKMRNILPLLCFSTLHTWWWLWSWFMNWMSLISLFPLSFFSWNNVFVYDVRCKNWKMASKFQHGINPHRRVTQLLGWGDSEDEDWGCTLTHMSVALLCCGFVLCTFYNYVKHNYTTLTVIWRMLLDGWSVCASHCIIADMNVFYEDLGCCRL